MPRIPNDFLELVFFLYPSKEAAKKGEAFGGSGFFTSIPSNTDANLSHVYAVTNRHLIEDGHTVIRINTNAGGRSYVETQKADWKFDQDDDLCVIPVAIDEHHTYRALSRSSYLDQTTIDLWNIGPGDDVFMIGRFINRDGAPQNSPSIRFGNISIMHKEKVKHQRLGHWQENISVEMRSIGGYSGSPVFVTVPPFSVRPDKNEISQESRIWLLGVDWGHVRTREPVMFKGSETHHPEGLYVEYNTGMANVVPAWRLTKLLDIPQFSFGRDQWDQDEAERRKYLAPADVCGTTQ